METSLEELSLRKCQYLIVTQIYRKNPNVISGTDYNTRVGS